MPRLRALGLHQVYHNLRPPAVNAATAALAGNRRADSWETSLPNRKIALRNLLGPFAKTMESVVGSWSAC